MIFSMLQRHCHHPYFNGWHWSERVWKVSEQKEYLNRGFLHCVSCSSVKTFFLLFVDLIISSCFSIFCFRFLKFNFEIYFYKFDFLKYIFVILSLVSCEVFTLKKGNPGTLTISVGLYLFLFWRSIPLIFVTIVSKRLLNLIQVLFMPQPVFQQC